MPIIVIVVVTTLPKRKITPSLWWWWWPRLLAPETLASIPSFTQAVVVVVCISGPACEVAAIAGGVELGVVGHIDRGSEFEIEIEKLIWSCLSVGV